MKSRLALVAAGAALAALAMPSSAAPPVPQVTDLTGDANMINGQLLSGDPLPPGVPTPVGSDNSKDIVSVLFESQKSKAGVCTGFRATLELKGPANLSNVLYRVRSVSAVNTTGFWLQHRNNVSLGTVTTLRLIGGPEVKTIPLTLATVAENKIIFNLTMSDLKAAGESAKTVLSNLGSDIRTDAWQLTAPQWDEALSDSSFKVCG